MRKLFIEGVVIFISILASLSVDNMRDLSDEQEILNEAVTTLGDEIKSNIKYTIEHIKQVRNMLYLTSQMVDKFNEMTFSQALKIHSDKPYMHSITEDGKVEYIKKYENENYNIFIWTNAWEPEDVFFQSMLYSGKLLEIKNKSLRKKIESIYTNQEERISGMHKITGVLAQDILKWFDEKENEINKDIKVSEIFNTLKDQKLKNFLKRRRNQLSQRITDLENYLQSLEKVVLLINTNYKV
ncbi:MAG: hypothetical protein VXY15_03290 [Bacteroidota bacterium]|nr:hypothetical protein [Bacteroidota bacterium]|tara:strand:+ start:2133 stop:2855 length:723 start_codon:yes stop_codon:yes gene_type:complete